MRLHLFVPLILVCAALFTGCADMQFSNPFTSDPLTGGQDATTSILLETPLPQGVQRYSSHGFIATGENGSPNGLETFRGNIDGNGAAVTMFNALKANGWNLRMQYRKGERAVYIYEKNGDMAAIVFRRQGVLTIMEVWRGPRLENGTILGIQDMEEPLPSLAGEEYGPLQNTAPDKGKTESWGNSQLEEKEL